MFQITQHSRDADLMKSLIYYFNSGRYAPRSNKDFCDFLVTTFSDIHYKIIPFLKKYEIEGGKANDFADFCKIAEIIKAKSHLTPEGLDEILKIKDGMNRKRLIDVK